MTGCQNQGDGCPDPEAWLREPKHYTVHDMAAAAEWRDQLIRAMEFNNLRARRELGEAKLENDRLKAEVARVNVELALERANIHALFVSLREPPAERLPRGRSI